MLKTTTHDVHPDEGSIGELVIETFDQMHNPAELWLTGSRPPTSWAAPVDVADPA